MSDLSPTSTPTSPRTDSSKYIVHGVELVGLALIMLAYGILVSLYALRTPLWQVPDEPAHYNYIAQLAQGRFPIIEAGDWNNAYLEQIKAARFSENAVAGKLFTIQYEDHQPPLYYLLATPIYLMTNGNPYALRFVSAFFGALSILVAWATIHTLFPRRSWLALGAAGMIAFIPQHLAMLGGINNDSLAELLIGLMLWSCIIFVDNSHSQPRWIRRLGHPLVLGLWLGLALITKLTTYGMILIVGVALLLRARQEHWSFQQFVRQASLVLLPALLLGSLWWVRNLQIYGGLDALAQARHDRVVVGQLTTTDYIAGKDLTPPAPRGVRTWIGTGIRTTFNSFWGQFGWMAVPMTDRIYLGLALLTAFAGVGLLLAVGQTFNLLTEAQQAGVTLLALMGLVAIGQTILYNLKFVQFQGRYLYPGLLTFAVAVITGLSGWTSLRKSQRKHYWVLIVPLALAVLSAYALFRILIPGLAG